MRLPAFAAVFAVAVAAGCGGTKTVTETKTVGAAATTTSDLAPPTELVLFGHIESLSRDGEAYELRFDPAWFLSGETANRAAAEDGVVEPGSRSRTTTTWWKRAIGC